MSPSHSCLGTNDPLGHLFLGTRDLRQEKMTDTDIHRIDDNKWNGSIYGTLYQVCFTVAIAIVTVLLTCFTFMWICSLGKVYSGNVRSVGHPALETVEIDL